jgi:hypothetical protein
VGIFEERLEGVQSPLWLGRGALKQELRPPPGSRVFARASHLKRNRDSSKASTALIITVNRQHDPAVEQAAPDAAEPGSEAVSRFVGRIPVFRGIEVSHPFSPCVEIVEHFSGQLEQVEPHSKRWQS